MPIDNKVYTRLDPILGKVIIKNKENNMQANIDYIPDKKWSRKNACDAMKEQINTITDERPMF